VKIDVGAGLREALTGASVWFALGITWMLLESNGTRTAQGALDVPARPDRVPRLLRFSVKGGFIAADGRQLGVWVQADPLD
jgi:hypothetical protein